jgi:hypothetical protein
MAPDSWLRSRCRKSGLVLSTGLAGSCIAPAAAGSFIITGSNGLPTRPDSGGLPLYPTDTVRADMTRATATDAWQLGGPIAEPTDVFQLPDGRLV